MERNSRLSGDRIFKQVIENDYYYVDKILFIKEVIDKLDAGRF
jgi:hypothetical protein